MQSIILVHADGARHLAFVTNARFDVRAWANGRRAVFARLGVIRVDVQFSMPHTEGTNGR